MFFLQRTDLQKEKQKALSDEAKRLYQEDPSLFKAAEEDFKSILQPFLILFLESSFYTLPVSNPCHSIVVDLPASEKLDDLASLLQLDSKNLDVRKLGIDAIKEQQRINLKFSSGETAILPDDKVQIMLAGVGDVFLS